MIHHLTKYAEAVHCITASAEETCDHLSNLWIARHECLLAFQSDNETAFVGELTKELMRRSQVARSYGSFRDLTALNERISGKRKSDSGNNVEGVLFPIFD